MSSLTYHTNGIVLDYFDMGEADRMYSVFTKEYGLVRLFAKSIRSETSKLAGHMLLFSEKRVAFVLGKSFPRLIDAEEIRPFSFGEKEFFLAGRLSRFVTRLIHGEENDSMLWDIIASAFHFLDASSKNGGKMNDEDQALFELLFGVRILRHLGYVGENEKSIDDALYGLKWDIAYTGEKKTALSAAYTKGIRASHL